MLHHGDLPIVVPATHRDIDTVASIAAQATREHPIVSWLFPSSRQRVALLPAWWTLAAEQGLHHGHVDLLADHSAAAIWMDRTRPAPPAPKNHRLTKAISPIVDAGTVLAAVLARHVPPAPHMYLALLAVAPAQRREGRATALLAHRHRHLDRSGTAAYLEAGTEEQLALHAGLGYRAGEAFCLPTGPDLHPMLRTPCPTARR